MFGMNWVIRSRSDWATLSKKERNTVQAAATKVELVGRRLVSEWPMLPPDEQVEYQNKAREARAKYCEQNRRYLAIASWGYRKRKYIDMEEAVTGRTPYDEYILKSTVRHHKKTRKARREEQESPRLAAEPESNLPDSSELSSSESVKVRPAKLYETRQCSFQPGWSCSRKGSSSCIQARAACTGNSGYGRKSS
ncbi:hypothetical protein C8F04DRAFT_1200388 [Mycena alexandri]|uniref:HMG box domain-containing protein n=1 Tax=Mycena alexandri TaxID=1745969 RepID=A0AAD6RYR7_9AGAR|nr:hypothetical protein C8F04DRAFT_1200388 [Mycena alexandri]